MNQTFVNLQLQGNTIIYKRDLNFQQSGKDRNVFQINKCCKIV